MSITFAESAVQDMEDILAYYTDQAMPQVGSRLVAEIIARRLRRVMRLQLEFTSG